MRRSLGAVAVLVLAGARCTCDGSGDRWAVVVQHSDKFYTPLLDGGPAVHSSRWPTIKIVRLHEEPGTQEDGPSETPDSGLAE
jgi:hypothetical protein